MIKAYCYGVFADTMTDEEFYEVEKAQRECHAAWAENFSAVSELLEMNHRQFDDGQQDGRVHCLAR